LTQTTASLGQFAWASASLAYWLLSGAADGRAAIGTPRHSAMNARLVLPLA
jgi:hypothetical protein